MLAPAKLNLSLEITGLLPNGYHALDMVMQAVTLYETVTLRRAAQLSLTMAGCALPADEHNLALRAARCFAAQAGFAAPAALTVEKRVPMQAGMGGGSADAAGVLAGLNALYAPELCARRGAVFSLPELSAMGLTLGADVPFALTGGTCRVQGVGEQLHPLPACPPCWFAVVMPRTGVSTPAAFAAYDRAGSRVHPDCAAQEQAIRRGDLAGLCAAAANALQECSGVPETPRLCAQLRQAGALAALMTGSGAAVYGIFAQKQAAAAAAEALRQQGEQVYLCAPDAAGARPAPPDAAFPG